MGRGGKSAIVVLKLLLAELTKRSRGLQKSESLLSETTDREIGDGEGESEGQAESRDRRSECWWAAANEGGLMNTGVSGGDPHRVQSPPARISVCTSPSHPSLTPRRLSSESRVS